MQAIVQNEYGEPSHLQLKELPAPSAGQGEVLVRVQYAAVHSGDYFVTKGEPYVARFWAGWPRPHDHIVGLDGAGTVEAVGAGVDGVRPGDAVFGEFKGSCAEYALARADRVATVPENLTLEQAAAMTTSALAALLGLRDAGRVKPGDTVLVNGASGGVGTFAIQIAKALGAEVTGVCSGRNVELVRSLGADSVVDYTTEDFTQGERRYDVILDNVGNRAFSELRRALTTTGRVVPNTGHAGIGYLIAASMRSMFVKQQAAPFVATPTPQGLADIVRLVEDSGLHPAIDRTYPLAEVPAALAYVGTGHARGKVVIAVAP